MSDPASGEAATTPPALATFEAATPARVSAREVLGRGFDLNLAASREIRSSAVLIGLLTLAAAAPVAAIVVAVISHFGGIDAIATGIAPPGVGLVTVIARNLAGLAAILGAVNVVALAVDSQLLGVTLIASRATNRPFVLRRALELIRLRFWRLLRANFLIGLILYVPRTLVERTVAPSGVVTETQFVVLTALGIVLSIPFAYVAAWIMLGPVGARESVRRSWRLARARPVIALVIAAINVVFQTIALFAAGAGLDVLGRIADAIGLERATGAALFIPLGLILVLAITAAGSLILTIAALTAAPQVVAFLRMTGVTNGLGVLHDPDNPFASARIEPLVSRGMKATLALEWILGAGAISQIV
jgi:hypothetical protein